MFIVDIYNKYQKQNNEVFIMQVGAQTYCVRAIQFEWGQPQLYKSIEHQVQPDWFHWYDTQEEAIQFLQNMKQLNG